MRLPMLQIWLPMMVIALVVSGCAIYDSTDFPTTSEARLVPNPETAESTTSTAPTATSETMPPVDQTTTTISGLVTVPDLMSLVSVDSVERVLHEAGLKSQIDLLEVPLEERENPDGIVALQEPEAKSEVLQGATVEVLVYASMPAIPAGGAAPGTWTHFTEEDGLASDCVTSIDITNSGTIWVGCSGGVSTFDGHDWSTVDDSLGVIDVVVDKEGGIWVFSLDGDSGIVTLHQFSDGPAFDLQIGSAETGAPPVVPERFHGTVWTALDGGPGWGVAISDDGVVWTSGPEDGLFRYDNEWVLISRPPWMSASDAPWTEAMGTEEIWTTPDGALWAVTDGLSRFDGSRWETYLEGSRVTDVAFASDGSVWAATMWAGAYHFDGGEWAHYGVGDGLVSGELTSVAVGIDGCIWFGTATDGVMRFTPDG